MKQYSIQASAKYIYSPDTKSYFEEVIASYNSGCYRACTVVLYIVVLTDLILKLKEMVEVYNDQDASKILEKVKKEQENNPTNPSWEKTLIDEISTKTSLLNKVELQHLIYLKSMRNASAHPIISESFQLSEINQETATCLIRNMVDSILSKPPYLTKKSIFDELLSDIHRFSKEARGRDETIHFVNEKYLSRLKNKELIRVFESLWKLVFKVNSEECIENRDYNFSVLVNLLQEKYDLLIERIELDKQKYNQMLSIENVRLLMYLVEEFPELYHDDILNFASKSMLLKHVEENFDDFCFLTILTPEILDHLNKITVKFKDLLKNKSSFEILIYFSFYGMYHAVKRAVLKGYSKEACTHVINIFDISNDFNLSDMLFSNLVKPSLEYFDKEKAEELIKVINQNPNIYQRRQHNQEREIIKTFISENGFEIDLSNYLNFLSDSPYSKK